MATDTHKSHISNKSRLQAPEKVIGAAEASLLKSSNPTDSLSAFTRFECDRALPNLAVTVGILIPVVNPRLIDVYHLTTRFRLQLFLECKTSEVISFSIPVCFFLRLTPILRRASLICMLRHVISPQRAPVVLESYPHVVGRTRCSIPNS